MKILYITNNLSGNSGWSRYSKDVVENIKRDGIEISCLTAETFLQEPGEYFVNFFNCLNTAKKINKKIVEFQPDIIHFMVEPYIHILPFLKTKKAKIFLTVHGTYSFLPNLFSGIKKIIASILTRKAFNKLDQIIAVSNYTKEYLTKQANYVANKISVITNGIDVSRFNDRGIPEPGHILFVGAIKSRKGILEALDVLSYYYNEIDRNFVFHVVGKYKKEDSYYQKIKNKIKKKGLENNVVLHGRINDQELSKLYQKASLYLMLSVKHGCYFEGFGLVYLEANAMGIPCIGAKQGGSAEAIINNKTGYIVDAYNQQAVANKIDLVLNKGSISKEDCLAWAKENDISVKIKELITLYGN